MSRLGLFYDGEFHDMSNYVSRRYPINEYPSGNRYYTNFIIRSPKTDHQFLDIATRIKRAFYDASQGDDYVRLVRADGSDELRYFTVYSGDVVKVDDPLWWRYTVSVEHVAWSETPDPAAESLSALILSSGVDRISAIKKDGSAGDRPARISETIVRSEVPGIRINTFWAGIKPDIDSFDGNIDFPGTYDDVGNERSSDVDAAIYTGYAEIDFTETESMIHRFESKFAHTTSGGQTTAWNDDTLEFPEKYPGKYRLLLRWNSNKTTSAFLIKVYAGFKDAYQLVATKRLQAEYSTEAHTFDAGVIELPSDADLSHYSVRISAARLNGVGRLGFDKGRIIPYEYSIKVGSANLDVRAGPPETPLTINTDAYNTTTAYAKGETNTARPVVEANNWSNPGGVVVFHANTAPSYEIDANDALTLEMTNYMRWGLHTPFVTAVIPTIGGPIGGTDRT